MRLLREALRTAALFCVVTMSGLPVCSDARGADVVDRILAREPAKGSKLFVSFCAEDNGLVGHAFLALSAEDRTAKACRVEAAVGFWPAADQKRLKALFSPLPGMLLDETRKKGGTRSALCRITIPISWQEYELVKIKIGAYRERNYVLTSQDCVTFCEDVAEGVLRLRVPDREKEFRAWLADVQQRNAEERFPARYIRKLAELNER